MNKFLDEILISLDRLYYLYEEYIWKNSKCKLEVLVEKNAIYFYLYKNREVIDEIILSFSENERKIYEYMCVRLLILLLGNVYIHNYDNLFYNDRHKPYLRLIVNDKEIIEMMKIIVYLQDDYTINENMEYVVNIEKSLVSEMYSLEFIDRLNERINVSKKLLKRV